MTFFPVVFGHVELRIDERPPRRFPVRRKGGGK
jgi:hypothetical protein